MKSKIFLLALIVLMIIGFPYVYKNKDEIVDESIKFLYETKTNNKLLESRDTEVENYTHRENSYYENLSYNEKIIYDYLHDRSIDILENQNTSTIIKINNTNFVYEDFQNTDLAKILEAFYNDYPYLAWWQNECRISMSESSNFGVTDLTITIKLAEYFRENGQENTLNKDLVNKASNSYKVAKELVESTNFDNANDALDSFKDYILSNVEYDSSAANNSLDDDYYINNYEYTMASNFIYVFDEDYSTNVLCGGYTQAFLLLCDLYGIKECYFITGYMNGNGHAWNTITNNGKRFLVDITNSASNTVGKDGELYFVEIPFEKEYSINTRYSTMNYVEY